MELGILISYKSSPIPSTHAFTPLMKKGISAPNLRLDFIRSVLLKLNLASLLIAIITVAAFELPPPRPAPKGIFLFMKISAPSCRFDKIDCAALNARSFSGLISKDELLIFIAPRVL